MNANRANRSGHQRRGKATASPGHPTPQGVRLQRVLARAGIAARRACERMIEEGRVQVNGQVVRTLPCFVKPGKDKVTIDGRAVGKLDRRIYVMLNKPARVLASTKDEPGADRQTLATLVKHPSGARLYPVGRLDYEATGLVLLTNDGDLTNRLTHPRYGVPRRYEAVVNGVATPNLLGELERTLAKAEKKVGKQRGTLRAPRVRLVLLGTSEGRSRLGIELMDGTATQVERVLREGGLSVKKLERISLGPLELSGVARGRWRDLDRHEVRALKMAARDPEADGPTVRGARAASKRASSEEGDDDE